MAIVGITCTCVGAARMRVCDVIAVGCKQSHVLREKTHFVQVLDRFHLLLPLFLQSSAKRCSIMDSTLDLSTLHALSPEVISKQATINIGTASRFIVHARIMETKKKNFHPTMAATDPPRCSSACFVATVRRRARIHRPQLLRQKKSARSLSDLFTGTIGHVAHGKSTVVKAISGVQVQIKGG